MAHYEYDDDIDGELSDDDIAILPQYKRIEFTCNNCHRTAYSYVKIKDDKQPYYAFLRCSFCQYKELVKYSVWRGKIRFNDYHAHRLWDKYPLRVNNVKMKDRRNYSGDVLGKI